MPQISRAALETGDNLPAIVVYSNPAANHPTHAKQPAIEKHSSSGFGEWSRRRLFCRRRGLFGGIQWIVMTRGVLCVGPPLASAATI